MNVAVLALLAGRIAPFTAREGSAIAKYPLEGRVRIGLLGIADDEQADRVHHGGRDKALHHYPSDHYAHWGGLAPDHPLLNAPGAFGENVSTWGMIEDEVFIGDRFRLGTAVIEISQGRQPCWKQGARMEWATLPAMMVRERRSGWYYRVIEGGEAEAGDELHLLERPLPDWSVKRVFGLIIGGDHKSDPGALGELRDMPLLFQGWRARAAELLDKSG